MRRFARLAVMTAVAGYLLVVVGGTVRVTGAGMGCGPDWPLCNGRLIPEPDVRAWTEFIHRLIALSIILLTGLLAVTGWRVRRVNRWYGRLSLAAASLVLFQAMLGAVTVFTHTDALAVTIHLGVGLSFLALTLTLALLAVATDARPPGLYRQSSPLRRFTLAASGGVFVVMLTGAYTAKSGASLACSSWPTCDGHWLPTGWSPVDIQLAHRLLAAIAAGLVVLVALQARRIRADAPLLGKVSLVAVGLMAVQILVGAGNIWFTLAPEVRIGHLALAALIWALLVLLTVLDWRLPVGVVPDRRTGLARHLERRAAQRTVS
jgi:heme A synthase